ncbi:hypothetical protein Tco_0592234, partial [Tanacetum coccineum]
MIASSLSNIVQAHKLYNEGYVDLVRMLTWSCGMVVSPQMSKVTICMVCLAKVTVAGTGDEAVDGDGDGDYEK